MESTSLQDDVSESISEPVAKKCRDASTTTDNHDGLTKESGSRPPFTRSHIIQRSGGKFHLLIGVTGSIAVIKLEELIQKLYQSCPENKLLIKVAATKSAMILLDNQDFELDEIIYEDRDEWSMWRERGDAVLHIELRKWADAMLIAPLDANSLAKIAIGISDNLVTSIVRAWDPRKPLYFAPAMNTMMWENPLTFQHRNTLKDLLRYKEIPPMEKELVCGDTGMGAMATTTMIATVIATVGLDRHSMWIFGYGSLLWNPNFPFTQKVPGVVCGYARKFWQLSPDHRGTPEKPGRTVTLVPDTHSVCWGIAFKVAEEHVRKTREYLDHREKAGYSAYISYGDAVHYAGPSDLDIICQTIIRSRGLSGSNVDYALSLANVLHNQAPHVPDDHVFEVERRILALCRAKKDSDDKKNNQIV